MQENVLALQCGTLFIFSLPIEHAAQGHPEYGLQKLEPLGEIP